MEKHISCTVWVSSAIYDLEWITGHSSKAEKAGLGFRGREDCDPVAAGEQFHGLGHIRRLSNLLDFCQDRSVSEMGHTYSPPLLWRIPPVLSIVGASLAPPHFLPRLDAHSGMP